MSNVLYVKRANGEATGKLVVKKDTSMAVDVDASIVIENAAGDEVAIDFASVTSLNLLGVEVLADSTATDVAGIVADYNALLAILRTANVIATA